MVTGLNFNHSLKDDVFSFHSIAKGLKLQYIKSSTTKKQKDHGSAGIQAGTINNQLNRCQLYQYMLNIKIGSFNHCTLS